MKKWIEGKWEYYRDDTKQLYMRREVGPMEILNYAKIADRELKCLICGHKWSPVGRKTHYAVYDVNLRLGTPHSRLMPCHIGHLTGYTTRAS